MAMEQVLEKIQSVTIVVFMVGNLLEVGLRLQVAEALTALRNVRFVVLTLLWCFVLGPGLAVLLTRVIPLSEPYALGLVFLGMAPCSPAVPMMVRKAGGSLSYLSAFMVLAFTGTVALMPFMVPWLATGFAAEPWTIAKPLVFFIAIPLVVGAAIRRAAETAAEKAAPVVKKVTGLGTLLLLAVLLLRYGGEPVSAGGIVDGFGEEAREQGSQGSPDPVDPEGVQGIVVAELHLDQGDEKVTDRAHQEAQE